MEGREMTQPETFLSRWSRLKRESEPIESAPSPEAGETASADRNEPATARPGTDAPISQELDPASLPPIDSITVDTDIRAFLQSGVSAELTRAALRRAWVSDPAIRDFIGIAENQWDFTDPTAIPGFGPLRETDDMPSLVAQALGKIDKPVETLAKAATTDPRHDRGDNRTRETADLLTTDSATDSAGS
jgi:hypothetical protein